MTRSNNQKWTLEPPDVAVYHPGGVVDLESVRGFFEACRATGWPAQFHIVDLTGVPTVGSEARRRVTEESRTIPLRGVAIVGTTFTTRIVATLITRALGIFHGDGSPTVFFASEKEARVWIDERRRAVAAGRSPS